MKNKKITALLLSAALGLCAIGCSDINAEDPDPSKGGSYSSEESEKGTGAAIEFDNVSNTPYDEDEAVNAYLDYSFDLCGKTVAKGNDNENIMISPASAFIALEMTAAGARGTTLEEMSGLLKDLGAEDPMAVQHFAIDYQNHLNNAKGVKLRSADSIWLNSDILKGNINGDYTDYAADGYHAEIKESAFGTDTIKEINGWVDDNTDHMIPTVIQDLNPFSAAVLVNAIAFDGDWAVQYADDQVHENDFTNADGKSEDGAPYNKYTKAGTGFDKQAYYNSRIREIILPNTITSIGDYAFSNRNLTTIKLNEGVKIIGESAFSITSKITSIIIPSTVETMGYYCFSGCSLLRKIIYLSSSAPQHWTATSFTYVPNKAVYGNPTYAINNASVIEMITFSQSEFEYTGKAPNPIWTNNMEEYTASFTMPTLQSEVGSYEEVIPVTFTKGEESFTANIPYSYTIVPPKLKAKVNSTSRTYGEANPDCKEETS